MKKRIVPLIYALIILFLQIPQLNVSAYGEFVNEQVDEIIASGNGFFCEAENATYYDSFGLEQNSDASGGLGLKALYENKNSVSSYKNGQIELTFTAEKAGTYVAWARLYAENGSQDSIHISFLGQGYSVVSFSDNYGEFNWVKLGTKYLNSGELSTLRVINREKNTIVDAFIVTPTSFVPSGISGNLPKEEIENTITSNFAPTPVKPPKEHPRVLFTKADIPRIKENMEKDENRNARSKLSSLKRYSTNGITDGKYNLPMLCKIEAFAFDYAVNGNKNSGNIAASAISNYFDCIDTVNYTSNYTREGGATIYFASKIYDWCYDLLTDEQKKKIINICEMIAHRTEIGWPPNDQGSVVGHGSEAQLLRDMLSFAIAVYDERPDIWEAVGGRFYEEFVPARNYFNKSGWHHQGDSYGLYRHRWDAWSYFLITGMGASSPYNDADLSQMGYGHIYMRRPDGQYLRDGDTANDTSYGMWKYWQNDFHTYLMDSVIGNDPYLKDEFISQNTALTEFYDGSPTMHLIINNPELKSASVENLPKSRFFPDPSGVMVARTGWDKGVESDDVVCEMKIGGIQVNNHQHFDAGHFQIYYKGILASDSGVYQGLKNDSSYGGTTYGSNHYNMYMTKTIAHNSMLIYDPNESNGQRNRRDITDGGQRAAGNANEPWSIKTILNDIDNYRTAEVVGREIDPKNPVDPEYTYIKGDLTNAYSNKVTDFKRSFMFFNFFDEEVPAALVVFDKVTSSDASFKKTWLLHGAEEPTVNGNQTIFRRTYQSPSLPVGYNGKMTVDTMLPKAEDAVISIVGGEEEGYSNVNGYDYTGYPAETTVDEGNTYRMELSPKASKKSNYFLNVIQVSDNDKNHYITPKLIESTYFYGVQIKNRAVFFSKTAKRIGNDISLSLGDAELKVTVCDAKAGKWSVTSDGITEDVYATEDGGVLSFEAKGNIVLHYVSDDTAPNAKKIVLGVENPVNVKFAGQYVHTKVKPELVNEKVMMPLSAIADWFKINTVSTKDGFTLVSSDTTAKISVGSSVLSVRNTPLEMDVAVYEKDGEIMVPADEVISAFGGYTQWHKHYNLISIGLPEPDYSLADGYAVVNSVTGDGGDVDGENYPENAVDGDISTIWASQGAGRYIDIELDKAYILDRAEIIFNPNGERDAKFQIRISSDGVHYITAISGTGDGSVAENSWEVYEFNSPITVKYVRYVGMGSNISDWNAIKEVRFREYLDKEEKLDVSIDDSGNILTCASVRNDGIYSKNGQIVVAQYSDDGRMLKADISDRHIIAPKTNGIYKFDVIAERMKDTGVIKAFLWDSICNAKPYQSVVVTDSYIRR